MASSQAFNFMEKWLRANLFDNKFAVNLDVVKLSDHKVAAIIPPLIFKIFAVLP